MGNFFFCEFLKIFDNAAKTFSGIYYPITNELTNIGSIFFKDKYDFFFNIIFSYAII